MNLTSMFTRECIVTTPGEPTGDTDAYGQPVLGPETVVHLDPADGPAAYLEQTSTTEITVGQQTAPGVWWAGLPTGTNVKPTSTLEFPDSGQTFHVAGEVATRWSPWDRRIEFLRVDLDSQTAGEAA